MHSFFLTVNIEHIFKLCYSSGDEEEENAIVSQVLDEIGIELTGKVCRHLILMFCKLAL